MGFEALHAQAGVGAAFWFWSVCALLFLAAELATTTFALLLLAIGAALAAGTAYFFPDSLPWQIVTFSIGAVAAVLVGMRRARHRQVAHLDVVEVTGQFVTVDEVDAGGRVQSVRWRDCAWAARSDDSPAFTVGEQARIVSVAGNVITISHI